MQISSVLVLTSGLARFIAGLLMLHLSGALIAQEVQINDTTTTSMARPVIPSGSGARSDIHIKALKTIYLSARAARLEKTAAVVLQEKLEAMYGVRLVIVRQERWMGEPAILLGPDLAISSGKVTQEKLRSVQDEGYVIEASENLIILSGNDQQGTLYAAYEFLRLAGLKAYPWHFGGGLEVITPAKDGIIRAISKSERPFFKFRDFMYKFQPGRYGGSLRNITIGDFRFVRDKEEFKSRGWLAWNHTAAFLVPPHEYYDDHPEYYGMKYGIPVPKSTRNTRVPLCTCEHDVHNISAVRALEWIGQQKDRRYFAVTNGDTLIQCPQCEIRDPLPDYITDRLLGWVNSVAKEVGKIYPDKVILTGAYTQSVKPPVTTGLEPNVLVMYAPWYWTSNTTSAVSFAHPLNVTAMEEFMGWSMLFPGQIGVYDYPGDWVEGTSEKLKLFARNGVTWYHANAPQGDLLHWVASQLLWDPLKDTVDLEQEFLQAYYGPAASVMQEYLELRQRTINSRSAHTRYVFRDRDFLGRVRVLMDDALSVANRHEIKVQTRILEGVFDGVYILLKNGIHAERDANIMRGDYQRFISLQRNIIRNGLDMRFPDGRIKRQINQFKKKLAALGVELPGNTSNNDVEQLSEAMLSAAQTQIDHVLDKADFDVRQFPVEIKKQCIDVDFSDHGESGVWETSGSQPELVSDVSNATVSLVAGERAATSIVAPLSRLATVERGLKTIHAGRFYAERRFSRPLNVEGCDFLDFHLNTSRDVPITIYVNNLHSDVQLHAGEQYVRIDLRNFKHRKGSGLFSTGKGGIKIESISFDIWPQDNFYPYPQIQDVELAIIGMKASNYAPEPAFLQGKKKVLWMSQFRANVPFEVAILDMSAKDRQRRGSEGRKKINIDYEYGRRYLKAGFRSFTEYRLFSPVARIITDMDASSDAWKAAIVLQESLENMYGITIPVRAGTDSPGLHSGNAILVGKKVCLRSGFVNQLELDYAGAGGFVINARSGHVAIAGENDAGTLMGVMKYLEEHGARFNTYSDNSLLPDRDNSFLRELYLVDRPYFSDQQLQCEKDEAGRHRAGLAKAAGLSAEAERDLAVSLAHKIKNMVRQGSSNIGAVNELAWQSPLSCYVTRKLLRDPFLDTGRLLIEFDEAFGQAATRSGQELL